MADHLKGDIMGQFPWSWPQWYLGLKSLSRSELYSYFVLFNSPGAEALMILVFHAFVKDFLIFVVLSRMQSINQISFINYSSGSQTFFNEMHF